MCQVRSRSVLTLCPCESGPGRFILLGYELDCIIHLGSWDGYGVRCSTNAHGRMEVALRISACGLILCLGTGHPSACGEHGSFIPGRCLPPRGEVQLGQGHCAREPGVGAVQAQAEGDGAHAAAHIIRAP